MGLCTLLVACNLIVSCLEMREKGGREEGRREEERKGGREEGREERKGGCRNEVVL